MNFHHLEAMQWVQLDSLDLEESWTPDGLTFDVVHQIQRDVYAELAREPAGSDTSWLSLSEDERTAIRPRSGLRTVADQRRPPTSAAVAGEAA
ncbi:hypothetical protein ACFU8R_16755 [Pseudonocardia alni]|uniref:hypothetical protein n=1 Tax=Pseudonocardia alni TaxID=33907 RepID=UPI0036A4A097